MSIPDDFDNDMPGVKETPSSRIYWSYLLTKYLDLFGKCMYTKDVGLMDDTLDFLESLIGGDLPNDYYEKVKVFRDKTVEMMVKANPVNRAEEVLVSNSLAVKVSKYRFRLIMQSIHKAGFTIQKYVDES